MGTPSNPQPSALIVSIISAGTDPDARSTAFSMIENAFGKGVAWPSSLPFDKTDYYATEMGSVLIRDLWLADDLFDRSLLAGIKIKTNEMEKLLSRNDGTRRINLDPGFMTAENFILATTKNYSHRVFLMNGIFADLTLIFKKGEFHPLEWTYPDYSGPEIRNILRTWRTGYIARLKQSDPGGKKGF